MPNTPAAGDHYEAPVLVEYGTIEEWTRGRASSAQIDISIIIDPGALN